MNLLFDLDGTLTDPFEGITRCIAYALKALNFPIPPRKRLQWCIGPPLKHSFSILMNSSDDSLAEEALAKYRERYATTGLFENRVYPEMPGILRAFADKGHTLYVATSKPEIYAKQIVAHFDLERYFKRIHGSCLDGTRSDKRDLVSNILRIEALEPSQTLMIGDRKHDMIGANGNGIRGLGVLWGYGTREELESSGAVTCVASPRDLVTVVNGGRAVKIV